jgi:transcriptional regulator with XRE-family HTH domain
MNKNPYLLQIGRKIKSARLSNGTKIREIAEKANVSKGLISKIENGRTIPSLPVLLAIIDSLNINFSDFFKDISPSTTHDYTHIKEHDYSLLEKEKSTGFQYYNIYDHVFPDFSFAVNMLLIDPNSSRSYVTTDGHEFIFVLEGSLDYRLGDEVVKLKKGDSLFFNGQIPHLPSNTGEDIVKLLVIYILL